MTTRQRSDRRKSILGPTAALALVFGMALGHAPVPAAAQAAASQQATSTDATGIAIADGPYELSEADDDTHTLTIAVSNVSVDPAAVTLAQPGAQGCKIDGNSSEVAAHRSKAIKFTLQADCQVSDTSTPFELTVASTGYTKTFPIAASAPKDTSPSFTKLWWYLAGLLVGGILAWLCGSLWIKGKLAPEIPPTRDDGETAVAFAQRAAAAPPARSWWVPLPSLKADWSFKDSWGSNLGLAAALFTALLGAGDMLKEILGEDKTEEVTLAVVSAAISAALIGAAPLALAICKRPDKPVETRENHTAGGVLIASATVLTATIGQIVVMVAVLGTGPVVVVTALVALLALGAYTIQTVPLTLTKGLQAVKPEPDVVEAVDRVAQAVALSGKVRSGAGENVDYPELDSLLQVLQTSPGDDRGRRRGAATFAAML